MTCGGNDVNGFFSRYWTYQISCRHTGRILLGKEVTVWFLPVHGSADMTYRLIPSHFEPWWSIVRRVREQNMELFCCLPDDKVQRADRSKSTRWRWIWCYTPCETSAIGSRCLQGTEDFSHPRWLKVCAHRKLIYLICLSFEHIVLISVPNAQSGIKAETHMSTQTNFLCRINQI